MEEKILYPSALEMFNKRNILPNRMMIANNVGNYIVWLCHWKKFLDNKDLDFNRENLYMVLFT